MDDKQPKLDNTGKKVGEKELSKPHDEQAKPFKGNDKPDTNLHPKVMDKEMLRNSGREVGLVNSPIVSVAPASGQVKNDKVEPKIINDVSLLIGDDGDEDYPYEKLKVEQGFFVPTQPNDTTDNLLAEINISINKARQRYGTVEINEDGDEIWESILEMTKKRLDDGAIALQNGKPITGANQTNRPKYIYTRNFVAKPVVKGQALSDSAEAEGDGVIVIRVA